MFKLLVENRNTSSIVPNLPSTNVVIIIIMLYKSSEMQIFVIILSLFFPWFIRVNVNVNQPTSVHWFYCFWVPPPTFNPNDDTGSNRQKFISFFYIFGTSSLVINYCMHYFVCTFYSFCVYLFCAYLTCKNGRFLWMWNPLKLNYYGYMSSPALNC